jgi:hypothetical protein
LGHQSLLVCGRWLVTGVGEGIAGFSLSLWLSVRTLSSSFFTVFLSVLRGGRVRRGRPAGRAGRAAPSVDDLGLVDDEAAVVGGVKQDATPLAQLTWAMAPQDRQTRWSSPSRADQRLGVDVRMRLDGVQHRQVRAGDLHTRRAQYTFEVGRVRHSPILEISKERVKLRRRADSG